MDFNYFLSTNGLTVEDAKREYAELSKHENELKTVSEEVISQMARMVLVEDEKYEKMQQYNRLQLYKAFKEEGAWQD